MDEETQLLKPPHQSRALERETLYNQPEDKAETVATTKDDDLKLKQKKKPLQTIFTIVTKTTST